MSFVTRITASPWRVRPCSVAASALRTTAPSRHLSQTRRVARPWFEQRSTALQMTKAERAAAEEPEVYRDDITIGLDRRKENQLLQKLDPKQFFVPRKTFPVSESITRSYYLGHHVKALKEMVKLLSSISIVFECRDIRVPLTAANPHLERALAGRERIIVYTKADLIGANRDMSNIRRLQPIKALLDFHKRGVDAIVADEATQGRPAQSASGQPAVAADGSGPGERAHEADRFDDFPEQDLHSSFGDGAPQAPQVLFTSHSPASTRQIIKILEKRATDHDSLIGMRGMIAGMPNAGKSSLLNALRRVGQVGDNAKARKGVARVANHPGVTRKLSTPVRVTREKGDALSAQVYDTPGVFVPYVGDVESMLKLALVGCVKDGLVPMEVLADYLLFHLNLQDPALYEKWSSPTNMVSEFLENIGRRCGMLEQGGEVSHMRAAEWIVQQWRKGELGKFMLDDLSPQGMQRFAQKIKAESEDRGPISLSAARKIRKDQRKVLHAQKQAAKAT
ncbi:P-loop containing nucleoside triphosphate hydrolase protein [Microdochium bolleyi]|uniref:p-loop containing nucleoside triphosphate hydrolase protein n=1 Tax=Microdochium bolleyi TaxID=196109 RepID=A0A136J9R8_9PEZI|nr:P-loop containing nucleoside triphosphate hydrolase protein [Microdochium bolleyi]